MFNILSNYYCCPICQNTHIGYDYDSRNLFLTWCMNCGFVQYPED